MKIYKVIFTNVPPVCVIATDRGNAITQAVRKTRGYLSCTEQRKRVISAKLDND